MFIIIIACDCHVIISMVTAEQAPEVVQMVRETQEAFRDQRERGELELEVGVAGWAWQPIQHCCVFH